jgi:hypothetical protein
VTGGVQNPPLIEDEVPFRKTQKSWKEQKYGHGSRRGPNAGLTVLVRTSSNLPVTETEGLTIMPESCS